MFILRRISSEGKTINEEIGKDYSVIYSHDKDFEPTFVRKFGIDNKKYKEQMRAECFAFIISDGGQQCRPLYRKSNYYVMTETGKTFEHLNYK